MPCITHATPCTYVEPSGPIHPSSHAGRLAAHDLYRTSAPWPSELRHTLGRSGHSHPPSHAGPSGRAHTLLACWPTGRELVTARRLSRPHTLPSHADLSGRTRYLHTLVSHLTSRALVERTPVMPYAPALYVGRYSRTHSLYTRRSLVGTHTGRRGRTLHPCTPVVLAARAFTVRQPTWPHESLPHTPANLGARAVPAHRPPWLYTHLTRPLTAWPRARHPTPAVLDACARPSRRPSRPYEIPHHVGQPDLTPSSRVGLPGRTRRPSRVGQPDPHVVFARWPTWPSALFVCADQSGRTHIHPHAGRRGRTYSCRT